MNFLFESLSYSTDTAEQVITLQSIDTLKTVVSDADLAPRLEPLLKDIVLILNTMTPVITYPDYFEFLLEFVKFYEKVLHGYILDIL